MEGKFIFTTVSVMICLVPVTSKHIEISDNFQPNFESTHENNVDLKKIDEILRSKRNIVDPLLLLLDPNKNATIQDVVQAYLEPLSIHTRDNSPEPCDDGYVKDHGKCVPEPKE